MQSGLKIIKRRIKSAKNIGQITKAMEMIAASKMRRAQKKALQGKPYAQSIYEITNSLMKNVKRQLHPLLETYEIDDHPLIILISANRGLCGSLNLNLLRKLAEFMTEKQKQQKMNFDFIALGKKGLHFTLKYGQNLKADFSDINPFTEAVGPIIIEAAKLFITEECTSVWLAYNNFINALRQEPIIKQLLPLKMASQFPYTKNGDGQSDSSNIRYLIEPSAKEVIDELLPFYLEAQVREAILEAEASEYSARMVAMKNATDNAAELVTGLTLEYNKARQQAVTTEIADIVTAKISMEKK